jgi:AraC-like DNA-binding protein
MFSVAQNAPQPKAFISGQSVDYSDLLQTGAVDMICVNFQPHGARAFFDMPINELYNSSVDVDATSDRALTELQDRLLNTSDNSLCVQHIEKFLLGRLRVSKFYNYQRMEAALKSINAGQGSVEQLAGVSCLSYKQFKRVFAEYVGANPKDFLRIIRFQKALYTLQLQPKIGLAQLSVECGFYDQPHLIREFKSFSGYTPTEYLAECAPYSDYFS